MFQCGCTSDVHGFPPERDQEHLDSESDVDSLVEATHQPQHNEDDDDEELQIESAKDYMERIAKQLASMEESQRKEAFRSKTDKPFTVKLDSRQVSDESQSSIATVFRMSTRSTSTINNRHQSLKHTDSESTQETVSVSDDEFSLEDEQDQHQEEAKPEIVSILRRKEKLGSITAPSGSAVRFCPTTVFPDPNEVPQKRKKVRRIPKKTPVAPIEVPCESYESQCKYSDELRRMERRAQQNQYSAAGYSYLTHDLRSPSSDILLPTESFYVFR